ncbi:L,D-transpeptidase Cds6 family protein [Pseudodesulfovibrio sp.]|uniref:L,D-transpeptidase family protein n=1 Tax=unclassified Pseudodesulfovibrio TaxID=2661612 RepID=UPI003AFF9BE1
MRILVAVIMFILGCTPAFADGWSPRLSSHDYGPKRILAVDKAAQTLIMLERKSPLHAVRRFPCTTGQSLGDKLVEGDLRTPEGVYFVGHKINRKLDWGLYGDLAYALNYPNPVDRIQGKTGGGIWLHGRGKEFLPRDTRGCVALKVPDMRDMARELDFGMPVVIASNLTWTPEQGESEATAKLLADRLRDWAQDWAGESDRFFSYYDPALMSLSEGQDFTQFVSHKRNVFAAKPWIHVMVDNIKAVAGPGYWVTWFDQYYRTTGMASTTGKRFYWKLEPDGTWRIVGREYTPPSEDLTDKYMAVVTDEAKAFVEKWRDTWLSMNAEEYVDLYASSAMQGGRKGATNIIDYKKALWAKAAPVTVKIDDLKVSQARDGLQVAFLQTFADATGYSDVGRKTMILTPENGTWKIESEQWRRGR